MIKYQELEIQGEEEMAINETLKFSWGHNFAFIAMIVGSYMTFMGVTYFTDGNFLVAGIGVGVLNLVFIALFIVPQILKATERKFAKIIKRERTIVIIAPIVYVVIMLPLAHFWTMFSERNAIETTFTDAIQMTETIFVDYEKYANERVAEYKSDLDSLQTVQKKSKKKKVKKNAISDLTKYNKAEALQLQLLGENYNNLKVSALDWVSQASGTTVWNVFMIGNIKTIEKAVENWVASLEQMSSKVLADEQSGVVPYTSSELVVTEINDAFQSIRNIYKTTKFPSVIAIALIALLYLMLMFPYLIQVRNTKSTYTFWGRIKGSETSISFEADEPVQDTPKRVKGSTRNSFTI